LLKIRLRRMGKISRPYYKIVVCNSSVASKTGKYIDTVGQYIPKRKPPVIEINREKLDSWVKKGAAVSDTVGFLLKSGRSVEEEKPAVVTEAAGTSG